MSFDLISSSFQQTSFKFTSFEPKLSDQKSRHTLAICSPYVSLCLCASFLLLHLYATFILRMALLRLFLSSLPLYYSVFFNVFQSYFSVIGSICPYRYIFPNLLLFFVFFTFFYSLVMSYTSHSITQSLNSFLSNFLISGPCSDSLSICKTF